MTIDELAARAGGVVRLAAIAGVDYTTVAATWRRFGRVPAKHVLRISDALDIPPHQIRPDLYREATG